MKLITDWGVRSRRLDQQLERDCPHCRGSEALRRHRQEEMKMPDLVDEYGGGMGLAGKRASPASHNSSMRRQRCWRPSEPSGGESWAALRRTPHGLEETIMTIFAMCVFSGGLPQTNPDAAAEALRAAGYQVFRLPPVLKARLEVEGDDFIEIRREGDNDDEDAREAMEAEAERIVSPFGGASEPSRGVTIAELWTPSPPRCAHCRELGTPDRPLLKIKIDVGDGKRRALLHNDCRKPWLDALIEGRLEEVPF
jgi:hypothetical protein